MSDVDISISDIPISEDQGVMRQAERDHRSLPPLTPASFTILLALADGEKHGYGIMQAIASHTGGALRVGPGTLYGTIKRLLEDGLIDESAERPDPAHDDARRRYYRLTDDGRRVAAAEAARLEGLVQFARRQRLPGPFLAPGEERRLPS
jgi:DNA-binding PadR family transcriptional regulator